MSARHKHIITSDAGASLADVLANVERENAVRRHHLDHRLSPYAERPKTRYRVVGGLAWIACFVVVGLYLARCF